MSHDLLCVEEGKCFSFMCKTHFSPPLLHVNSQKSVTDVIRFLSSMTPEFGAPGGANTFLLSFHVSPGVHLHLYMFAIHAWSLS